MVEMRGKYGVAGEMPEWPHADNGSMNIFTEYAHAMSWCVDIPN